ncbi:hypothetical protein TCAL_00348 [Tigriopus californicus]|uniref:NADH dehydrogenase [ubiquinone] 1 alpha subcomplex subunit 2 n=1 Tax=Tigriopus californicus TaxID=6832 RepID=A0A553NC36_TIGCA|nr:NADH dehydrogenase [ubiquinone] 1 alpha subcomplex subunit 2-like [Tigriopus californicus]TRY62975.1 hypothetical protein TCAL_00348 [Tigriopus californicus]|eukprot:TCALIF_00348-PA protein Name:"Similar to NDUFA2 NADH dehydrogenase [ubiquinone] 1 alpha subcomplex subunit 2 (Pongo pygmaeus)" AED:0.03 eAED:0.04 QI:0/-1/0/1/-1/1/1/0/92
MSSVPRFAATSLKELRIHLCQKSPASQGVRDFVSKHYHGLKSENPQFPIMIRECSGITPKIWARYAYGQEQFEDVSNKNADQVLQTIRGLAK